MDTTKTEKTKNTKKRRPRGTGSIYYDNKRKRYIGQIVVKYGDGSTGKKTVTGKTKTQVADKLRVIQFQVMSGVFLEEKKTLIPTIYECAEKMITEQLELNEIRQSTYYRKMETLKQLSDIYDKPIDKLSENDIIDFFKLKLDYSQSCINKMYQLLGAVLNKAVHRKIITENPIIEIKCPKSNKKTIPVRALTVDEQKKLLNVLKTEDILYSDIMLLSMFTGMRIGECCALKVENVDIFNNSISVRYTVSRGKFGYNVLDETKTSAGIRTLYINKEISDFLKNIIGDKKKGLLFLSSNNNLVTANQVNYSYSSALKKYKIIDETVYGKVDLHSLRHTYATRCIESGMPAKVLQKILGHTDINITLNTYCSVFEKFRNEHLAIADEYMKKNNLTLDL